jgi:hypothetical protein
MIDSAIRFQRKSGGVPVFVVYSPILSTMGRSMQSVRHACLGNIIVALPCSEIKTSCFSGNMTAIAWGLPLSAPQKLLVILRCHHYITSSRAGQ